jgi:hypothetical protein
MKTLFQLAILLFVGAAQAADFLSVTENRLVRGLESRGLSLGHVLSADGSIQELVANEVLYNKTDFKKVVDDIGTHLERIQQGDPSSAVGMRKSHRLFDIGFLKSPLARFSLVGVVLRPDRGFIEPESCGEVRLIYRLAYRVSLDGEDVASRLPMTVNLVFPARNKEIDRNLTCQEVLKKWQMPDELKKEPDATAIMEDHRVKATNTYIRENLLTREYINLNTLIQMEINLQSMRWPSAVKPDMGGHAEYLMKIYRWNKEAQQFEDKYLEDQIDTDKLQKDPALRLELIKWVKHNLSSIDQGLAVFPEKFLSKQAISVSPGGARRIQNRPFLRVINENELSDVSFDGLKRIKSVKALLRRLDDHTCSGCHQQKSVAGFHFIGKDPDQKYPLNSSLVAGSHHFLADQPRRREILNAYLNGTTPNFERGFAERTDAKGSVDQFKGTGLIDGWGAHCSLGKDPSYASWTCAQGYECRNVYKNQLDSALGVCYAAKNEIQVGDYCETGEIVTDAKATYSRSDKQINLVPQTLKNKSHRCFMNKGGFPSGIVWNYDCSNLPDHAACALLPSKKAGFNDCLAKGKNFVNCIKDYSSLIGLRRCDETKPCRDDFLCIQAENPQEGVCVPPYFLFQFRVDGHPLERSSAKGN